MAKRKDYHYGQRISRKDALLDFVWNITHLRFFDTDEGRNVMAQFFHVLTDQFVNVVRMVGVSERDDSQEIGRILHVGFWIVLFIAWVV